MKTKKRPLVRHFTLLVLLSICLSNAIIAQSVNFSPALNNGTSKDLVPASPSASSLGIYGQIPVSNYTGIPLIDIPLYQVSYKDISIPLGLSYHASEIKPDIPPGEVGLGWALKAGGSITRVIRGMTDFETYPIASYPQPALFNPTSKATWSSDSAMRRYLKDGYVIVDDVANPDEFYFNINGVTGKFYMDFSGKMKVKTAQDAYYQVDVEVVNNKKFKMPTLVQESRPQHIVNYKDTLTKKRVIYKLTLTDGNGVKYVFGGTDQSIEFSRPATGVGGTIDGAFFQDPGSYIAPITWYLTSIQSPFGYRIDLEYQRGITVTKTGYCDVGHYTWQKQGQSPISEAAGIPIAKGEKSVLINTCVLSKITTPREVLDFYKSIDSVQLRFPTDPLLRDVNGINENIFDWYEDVAKANTERMYPHRMDSIVVNDKTNRLTKVINFRYFNDAFNTRRLKLSGVTIKGGHASLSSYDYVLTYNTTVLPTYLSYKTDHYGFYNGRNPHILSSNPSDYIALDQNAFFASKEPDSNYVQAELLQTIQYPTGGYTEFIWEPNWYGSYVSTWPFTVVKNQTVKNKITGGVRIKRVSSYTAPNEKASEKRYYYIKNYKAGGDTSSGVRAYQPVYYEAYNGTITPPLRKEGQTSSYNGTFDYWQWSSNPIYPMSATRGNHVTYSEVTEVNADNSFTVYKYKNYDNGYSDIAPVNYICDNTDLKEFFKEDEGSSMDLERGQPLSEEYFDAGKVLKKKRLYQYNDDPARLNDNIRVLAQTPNNLNKADIASYRVIARLIYTYFPYLKRLQEVNYEGSDSVVNTIYLAYHPIYRKILKDSTITSDGRSIVNQSRYPQEMADQGVAEPYQRMVNRSMVNQLVEKEKIVDGAKVSKVITEYAKALSADTALILPKNMRTQFSNEVVETRANFTKYDSVGNPQTATLQGGVKTCYLWSYARSFPVAKIVNADYATVEAVMGGRVKVDSIARAFIEDFALLGRLAVLRTDSRLSAAQITTYTYDGSNGLTSETDAKGLTTYYKYDALGRLSIVEDHEHNILRRVCYSYSGQPEDCPINRYTVNELCYGVNKTDVCNEALCRIETVYRQANTNVQEKKLFATPEFSAFARDGFYTARARLNGTTGPYIFEYIKKGTTKYYNYCGNVDPKVFRYYPRLLGGDSLCTWNGVDTAYGFGNNIAYAGTLTKAPQGILDTGLPDGYYVYNNQYFRLTNGVIGTIYNCNPVVQSKSAGFGPSQGIACGSIATRTLYYNAAAFDVGTIVYTNAALTSPAADGYYRVGASAVRVLNATIIFIVSCN
ncbi:RHS repeat protein [Chitinophaga sp. S165]|uniref:RHS repeat protein n=1 Tax=Chitinophaga sp. S165 TaxID=2135462 RepID=UPI000D71C077|nr:RHS repeat domain-containing protein [Chitinophaga sp. S165]PWV47153.1 YD repeat-containing protein [Chitinophaga sp. S165]